MSPSQAPKKTKKESTEDVTNKSKVLDSTEACGDGNSNVVSSPSSGDNSSPFEDDSSSSASGEKSTVDKEANEHCRNENQDEEEFKQDYTTANAIVGSVQVTDAPLIDIGGPKKRKKGEISSNGDSNELVSPLAKRSKIAERKSLAAKKRKKEEISSVDDSNELVSPLAKRSKTAERKSLAAKKRKKEEISSVDDSNELVSPLAKRSKTAEEKSPGLQVVVAKKEYDITKDLNDKSKLGKKASSMKEKIGSDWAEDKLVEAGDDIKNTSPTKNEENCNGDLSKHETKDMIDDDLLKEEKNNDKTEEKELEN
ncbi:predicted protein [Chaetoceros tenuissimus]|uniref:Uncharacterized protein n=1 Tax=Chaetoceros tenuissimus TaxID=426638 RepID=A0AAD3D436_9STRA|nr:predicted protein [Chaetoceros tenuissimus]